MPTSNHNTSHKGNINSVGTNNNNNKTTSGGFSLTTSLKGGARSVSSNNSTGVDPTTRLREAISNSSPAVSSAKNLRRSAPSPNTNNNNTQASSSSIGAAHPIQTTKSFNSATNYTTKQQQSQTTNQQHQRRTASYRNQPNNKSKASPRNTVNQQGHRRSESAGGRLWNNFTNMGLSPVKSMDSDDRESTTSSRGGTGSIYTSRSAATATSANNNSSSTPVAKIPVTKSNNNNLQSPMNLSTSSFDDCYRSPSSQATPGYTDAFTLLDGVERAASTSGSSNTPSPVKKKKKDQLKSFLPSSPKRSTVMNKSQQQQQPSSPTRSNQSGSGFNESGGLKKKMPSPLFTNTNNNDPTTPPRKDLDIPQSQQQQDSMPDPPSNQKKKKSAGIRSASPIRAPSPLGGRVKSSIAAISKKINNNNSSTTGQNARSRSPSLRNRQSNAVSAVLNQDDNDTGGVEVIVQPKSIKSGISGGDASGFEILPRSPTKSSKSSTTSRGRSGLGSIGGRIRNRSPSPGGSRMRNRSPSPARKNTTTSSNRDASPLRKTFHNVAKSLTGSSIGGSHDELDNNASSSTTPPSQSNNTSGKATTAASSPNLLHMDKDSQVGAPSFFGGTNTTRGMSPGRMGRMKRSLKKRLAAPSTSTTTNAYNKPPSSPKKVPLPLHPGSSSTLSDYGTISNKGSVDYDDNNNDALMNTLLPSTMSFDVGSDDRLNTTKEPPPQTPTIEKDLEDNEGYFINTTSFSIFESYEFLKAMGGSESEALVITNYIRMGDSLCCERELEQQGFDKTIQVYYAGLGAILSRVREWSLEKKTEGDQAVESSTTPDAFHVLYKDFVDIAHCSETNILLLAMSSILLRSGNAHFRLHQYEQACRDYNSAQAYRLLQHEATDLISQEKIYHNGVYIEDAKLNGRISNNMASSLSKQGKYEEARSEYAKALHIKQSSLEILHKSSDLSVTKKDMIDKTWVADIASTFHNIGLLRMNCGEPKKAEKAYKQSLSLRVKKFGLDDIGVSSTLSALGHLYYHQKQHDDAFRSYKESLRIWKSQVGKSDLKTAEHYYNIGLVFYSKGPYSKAKTSVTECLRIRSLCLQQDSLLVAAALYLLGLIAISLGNYDEALSLLNQSLSIRQKLLESDDHLLVLNVQLAVGNAYQKKMEYDDAFDCYSTVLIGRTQRIGKDSLPVSEVLQAIGVTYSEAEQYNKAFKTLEEALRIRRSSESSSLEVAETLNSLSYVLFKSGDTEKAIELSEESLDLMKSAIAFDHILVSKVLKNIGDYYQDIQAYDEATEAYNESLRVMTSFYGQDHVLLSEVLNEIGVTRFKSGDYPVAKQSFTEALRLMRLSNNEANKSAIFPTLNHLGHALYKNNELNLASEIYIESFNIQVSIVTGVSNNGVKEFGTKLNTIKERVSTMQKNEEDVSDISESLGGIAGILRYLGLVIQEQGDFEMALSINKLSLSVRLCQPFKEHAAIALMAETIAMFEYKRGNLESAMDYFNQALDAKKSFQGESTIDVARTVNNLANIHFSIGNLDEAMDLYQEALEIKKQVLGDDSDEVANTLNNIAHVMVSAGKEEEALKVYHNVVKIRQDRYGKSDISVAVTLASMGDVYIKLGKLDVAKTYFEQCIRIQRLKQDHCDERVLENLGSIYGKLGEWQKAESTFKDIIDLKRDAYGDECLDVAKTLDLLAVSYIEQNRYADSIEHLQEALRVRRVCLDDEDDEVLASLNKLAFVYKSLDMRDQMTEVRDMMDELQARRGDE